MKKMLYIFVAVFSFLYIGCSDDTGSTTTDPFGGGGGGGGGGTGNVTFQTAAVQNQAGDNYFEFKPSTGIVVTQIVAVCTAINVNETVPVNDGNVYTNADPLYLGPVQNMQVGQQWQFTITGKVGSATGQAFTSTVNYTVQ